MFTAQSVDVTYLLSLDSDALNFIFDLFFLFIVVVFAGKNPVV